MQNRDGLATAPEKDVWSSRRAAQQDCPPPTELLWAVLALHPS